MDLHRTDKRPQWAGISAKNRNVWQQVASRTSGVITPGNVVSVAGAGLVAVGLVYTHQGSVAHGLAFLLFGRLADIADGVAAARTGTKSPFGESVDAVIDKLTMLAALIVFVTLGVVPAWAAALVALHNATNAGLGIAAKVRRRLLHPSWPGKLATGFQWGAFFLFIGAELFRAQGFLALGSFTSFTAWTVLLASLGVGAFATHDYVRKVTQKGTHE
jgi:phosphatidylglycerophosphate synthase